MAFWGEERGHELVLCGVFAGSFSHFSLLVGCPKVDLVNFST